MLAMDDLNRVAEVALDRVEPQADSVRRAMHCHVDHGDIARAGVEEGLKLALRLLRDRTGAPALSQSDHSAGSQAPESDCPRGVIEAQQTWR